MTTSNKTMGLQEWANTVNPSELTESMVEQYVREHFNYYSFLTLAEAQEINPEYKSYEEPTRAEVFTIEGEHGTETFTVKITGIWLGDGAVIDFYMLDVTSRM